MGRQAVVLVLAAGFAVLLVPLNLAAQDTRPVSLGFEAVPLRYMRILYYNEPLPKKPALYVREIEEGSPPDRSLLRVGNMIRSINDQPVHTLKQATDVIERTRGDTIEMTVYQKTPRYRKRLQDDPFYEPRRITPYHLVQIRLRYAPPQTQPVRVVVGLNRRLFHRFGYQHTPDPRTHRVYESHIEAKEEGLNPCPVCFPSQTTSALDKLMEQEFGQTQEIVERLVDRHDTVQPPPPEGIEPITTSLFEHRLHERIQPRLKVLTTRQFHGFGLPDGQVLLSEGTWNYTEGEAEEAAEIAHLLAHSDLQHEHSPVQQRRLRSLLERGIKQVTGFGFQFEALKEWSPQIPGFRYYRDLLEQGYGEPQEREALFFGMLYMYRAGYDLDGMQRWIRKREDMESNVHPNWIDYLLKHPSPTNIMEDIAEWRKLIRRNFERSGPTEGPHFRTISIQSR